MKGSKELIEHYHKREEELGEKATKLNMYLEGYAEGYRDTKAIDHSEKHLNWIIKLHEEWSSMFNPNNISFKEFIDKKLMEG